MSKKIMIYLTGILFLGALFLVPIESGVLLKEDKNTKIQFFPWNSNKLKIGWRHSVELTSWEETYYITKKGDLSLNSTKFKSYGAGTPDTDGDVEFLPNGYLRVTDIDRLIPFFSLYYVPMSDYYIKDISSDKYYLEDYVSPYTDVIITYENLNVYEWLWLKVLGVV